MAYRETVHTSSSDESTDNDDDETYWKRRKHTVPSAENVNRKQNIKPHYQVWRNVTYEQKMNHILSTTSLDKDQDLSNDDVPQFIDLDSVDQLADGKTEKFRHNTHFFGKNPPSINWNRCVSRAHIAVNFDSPPSSVIEEIIIRLEEPRHDLIAKVVENLGVQRALEYYYLTEDIERDGGMLLRDGSRRRSPGGVYFNLIKISPEVSNKERKSIFLMDKQIKDKLKRRRREFRRKQAKIYELQTRNMGCDQISEAAHSVKSTSVSNQEPIVLNSTCDKALIGNGSNLDPNADASEEGEVSSSSQED